MTTAAIEVRIPTILRPYTKDAKVVSADGADLKSLITDLDRQYPGLAERLLEAVSYTHLTLPTKA